MPQVPAGDGRQFDCSRSNPAALKQECARQAGLWSPTSKSPPLWQDFSDPGLLSLERRWIRSSQHELRWLFRHELAQRRPGKTFYHSASGRLPAPIHWFNPLVWWVSSRARFEAELACDELVISREPQVEQVGYARALVKTAELLMTPQRFRGSVALLTREPAL